MVKTNSKKISIKSSAAKPSGKPPPGDKTLRLKPEIIFYTLEAYMDITRSLLP